MFNLHVNFFGSFDSASSVLRLVARHQLILLNNDHKFTRPEHRMMCVSCYPQLFADAHCTYPWWMARLNEY